MFDEHVGLGHYKNATVWHRFAMSSMGGVMQHVSEIAISSLKMRQVGRRAHARTCAQTNYSAFSNDAAPACFIMHADPISCLFFNLQQVTKKWDNLCAA
jgi:hypothetical protein